MPTLFKQSHSPYWYISYIVDGRRHKISTKTSNRVNAEKTLHSLADKINRNDFFVQEEISNEEFVEKYLLYSQNHKSKGTYERDRTVINSFFKIFDLSFCKIKPIHIEEYINNRIKAKKKHSTINREFTVLKAMFNKAIHWGYISQNPAKNIKKLPDTTKKLPRFLTIDEIKMVLAECSSWLYNIVVCLILTGMRVGELINLTWNDINFKQQRIHIQSKDGWTPKTYEIRTIPMHPMVIDILKKLPKNTKYVFTSPEGHKLIGGNLQKRYFKKITNKLGLKDATIHTLRHTFASHLVMKGVDILTVSKLLGHSDIKTTMIYSHIAPDHLHAAVNLFPTQDLLPYSK
ncbi:MAG: tyrosine-type recombinase/integrase [Elusimicrobiota bacterium]